MVPFESASYFSQVRRLRDVADRALRHYPIRQATCRLIDHGENTTFRITAETGSQFLLRIHRRGYHTEPAILEELRWLERLSATSTLKVPKPVRSRNGRSIELVASPLIPQPRYCCVFEWIHGRFLRRSLAPPHMRKLGSVIAELQRSTKGVPVVGRRYWDAEGLVGTRAKFGSVENIKGIPDKAREVLGRGTRMVLRRLKRFEAAYPHKQGLIHADLHFGNVLLSDGHLAVIDFDDCGFGFHAYDLAVNLSSIEYRKRGKRDYRRLKDALIETYARDKGWDSDDERVLPHLITARKLAMLGWLHTRSDNPRLKQHVERAVAQTVKHLGEAYDLR